MLVLCPNGKKVHLLIAAFMLFPLSVPMKQPVLPQSAVKSGFTHIVRRQNIHKRQFLLFPCPDNSPKIIWRRFLRSAELHSPCFCRSNSLRLSLFMFSRSLCATKDRICNTRSAIKVPIKSLPFRVSSRGISSTQISIPISLVRMRHWFWISS